MVIIISYNKQTWNEYNDNQTAHENLAKGGIISADRLNHMENGISNNDNNKVTDNKNGSIQVNGSSITPADNSKVLHSTITQLNSADMNSLLQAGYFNIINGKNVFPKGDNYTIYQVIPLSNTNGVQIAFENAVAILGMRAWNLNPGHLSFTDWITFADDSKVVHSTDMRKPASEVAGIGEVNAKQDKIGYTPADDSKVVHSKDMRKPASDVVGIEEVNTKQDKISYTPADDSKVVHHTIPKSVRDMNDEISDGLFYDTSLETLHSPFSSSSFYYQVFAGASGNIRQVAYANLDAFNPATRSSSNNGSTWTNWNFETIVDDDGLMTYGSSNWQIKVIDDSKVAHLSGANNFDTVPTVNNNPLLLASSLPADLARTGQDEHFTRNITFDNIPRMSNGDPLATASQTGDVNKLLTKDKSSYVNSINELASIVDRFYPVASQVIPTDNISYSNQCLVYNYDPSKNTVTFRKNDASYSINYDTSAVGTNFTENSGGAAPLDGIRIYFGFKSEHYINGSEGTLSDQSYYVWDPSNSGSIKSGSLGLLKGIPYYLTSDNFDVGSNYTIDFSGNGMNLSASGNNRIAPKLIISNKGNGVLNITPYHGEDFRDDKSEGYWIYPYITKIVSYSIDTTAMKALPNGYSYDYVKDNSAQSTGNYLTAWGQGSYQYKFDLNNLGNGYSIDSMGSSITINVSIKGTESSTTSPYGATDGYKSSQFPNGTFTTYSGDTVIGQSAINLSWRLSKEDVVSSSYTAYYQAMAGGSSAIFYAIKLVINNDNTISIYVVNPFASYNYNYTYTTNPSMSSPNAQPISNSTTISIVNNV